MFTPDLDGDGVGTSNTTLTWTNAAPSLFIDVYIVFGPGPADFDFVGSISGTNTTVTVTSTVSTDVIVLQFFAMVDGGCYGSPTFECPETPDGVTFVQGLCNGTGPSPQISSAVFGLNYLFQGGSKPPCIRACMINGDNKFDISDMLYILSYLFLGGQAPTLWVDTDADGQAEQACSVATPEDDCETGHEVCAP